MKMLKNNKRKIMDNKINPKIKITEKKNDKRQSGLRSMLVFGDSEYTNRYIKNFKTRSYHPKWQKSLIWS